MRHLKFAARTALIVGAVTTASMSAPAAIAEEVYMIRGFMDVFSAGMNQMTYRLVKSGVNAKALSNGEWRGIANDIIRRSKNDKVSHPIIIAGHSLGGVEAADFANKLGQAGVKVSLVIGLDPGFKKPNRFGPGIKRVVNYKIPSGQNYRAGSGFSGKIRTIDVSKYGVDHVGIDKNAKVQSLVVSRIIRRVR